MDILWQAQGRVAEDVGVVRREPLRPCVDPTVRDSRVGPMTTWEYATVPLISHATKQILDTWGKDGWELVAVLPGTEANNPVAYLKRPTGQQ